MVRHYPYLVVLLFVGILLTFSAGLIIEGLSRVGFVLMLASVLALVLDTIRRVWGTGR
jgi:hypothetical protein